MALFAFRFTEKGRGATLQGVRADDSDAPSPSPSQNLNFPIAAIVEGGAGRAAGTSSASNTADYDSECGAGVIFHLSFEALRSDVFNFPPRAARSGRGPRPNANCDGEVMRGRENECLPREIGS